MRRKIDIKQVCASIRRDVIEKLGIEVPTEEITILWKGGEVEVWINVKERIVYGSAQGRVMIEGRI